MCEKSEIRIRSSPTVVPKRNRPAPTTMFCDDLEDGSGSSSSSSEASPSILRRSLHFAHGSDDSSSDDLFVENGGAYDNGDAKLHIAERSVTFSPNNQIYAIPMRRRRRHAGRRRRRERKNATTLSLGRRWIPVLVQMVCTVLVLVMVRFYRSSEVQDAVLPGGLEQRYQRIRSVLAQRSRRLAMVTEKSSPAEASATAHDPSSVRVFTLPDTLRLELEKELLRPEVAVDVTNLQSLEALSHKSKTSFDLTLALGIQACWRHYRVWRNHPQVAVPPPSCFAIYPSIRTSRRPPRMVPQLFTSQRLWPRRCFWPSVS